MLLKYFNGLNKLNIPDYLIQSDVIIEIPFKYGYINYYPYYREGEIILDFDRISKLEKILYSQDAISTEASEALKSLTLDDIYNCILNSEKQISTKVLKYEFEDLYYKLINLAKENKFRFAKINLEDNLYAKIVLKEVEFKSPNFFFAVSLNENDEIVYIHSRRNQNPVTYKEIQNYKKLINENLDKLESI